MKLSYKLILSFGILVSFSLGLGFFALYEMAQIDAGVKELGGNWLPSIEAISRLDDAVGKFRRAELLHVASLEKKDMQRFEKEIAKQASELTATTASYEKLISSEREQELFNKFQKTWNNYLKLHDFVILYSRENENVKASSITTRDQNDVFHEIELYLKQLIKLNDAGGGLSYINATEAYAVAQRSTYIAMAACLLCAIALAFMLIRNVLSLLGDDPAVLAGIAIRIAEGDMTTRFDERKAEIGVFGAVKKMAETIKNRLGFAEGFLTV